MNKLIVVYLILTLFFTMEIFPQELIDEDSPRLIGRVTTEEVSDIQDETVVPLGDICQGNAGLFVGVGEFEKRANLANLRYAPDDAIALAGKFVLDLQLIPPHQTILAISGEPKTEKNKQLLSQLEASGVHRIAATEKAIGDALSDVANYARKEGLIVASFASHGFEHERSAYIMPEDGRRNRLKQTGISLEVIKNTLSLSDADKCLIIIDACRERPYADTRSDGGMSNTFKEALKSSQGMAIMASCDVGQQSWESSDYNQGIFTYYLLQALSGKAEPDKRGYFCVGSVSDYAIQNTQKWVKKNRDAQQEPWFEGGLSRTVPLGISPSTKDIVEKHRLKCQELIAVLQSNIGNGGVNGAMFDDVQRIVSHSYPGEIDTLLVKLAKLKEFGTDYAPDFAQWWNSAGKVEYLGESITITNDTGTQTANNQNPVSTNSTENKLVIELPGGAQITFVLVKAGKYTMGSRESEIGRYPDESPLTKVELEHSIWVSESEVTQKQWNALMDINPSKHQKDENNPVDSVTWYDAVEFCNILSEVSGYPTRLPTEAEWEYACRSGQYTVYSFGDSPTNLHEYGWYRKNALNKSHPVKSRKPNSWGLYDMHGNLWEWCSDWHAPTLPGGTIINPKGPPKGTARVAKGGSWSSNAQSLRSARRIKFDPYSQSSFLGFRVICDISE